MTGEGEEVDAAVSALMAGGIAIIATDTVYGLVAPATNKAAIDRLYKLKQRPARIPLALLAAQLETVYAALPGLDGPRRAAMDAVLPGPYTLVVPDNGNGFRHLRGNSGATLGIRVPELPTRARRVVTRAGLLASTSANLHGGADPPSLEHVDPALVVGVDASVDDGELPGLASTVVDITGARPIVLRAGAVPASVALARLSRAFGL